jgi:acyl-coenzyme A synthetase/AMP-(fatty) acid ligase
VGVVGIYDPSKEFQLVQAYVVEKAFSKVSEQEICQWMEKECSATAQLTAGVEFLDELPRNEVGEEYPPRIETQDRNHKLTRLAKGG